MDSFFFYDVVIVGAGPAGSTCAMVLKKEGIKTLILEKESFPRQKLCTGLVTGEGENILNRVYPSMPADVYAYPNRIEGPKVYHQSKLIINSKNIHRNFDRGRLDQWMAKNSDAEIKFNANFTEFISSKEGRIKIKYKNNFIEHEISCKYLVAADGGNSTILQQVFPEKYAKATKAVGKQYRFKGKSNLDNKFFYLFMNNESFFRWAVPKDDTWIIGTGCNDKFDIDINLNTYLDFLKKEFNLKGEIIAEEKIFFNDLWKEYTLGQNNLLFAGEAAGFWGRAGDGIWYGIESGRICGESIIKSLKDNRSALEIYFEKISLAELDKRAIKGHNNAIKIQSFHKKVEA